MHELNAKLGLAEFSQIKKIIIIITHGCNVILVQINYFK